MKTYIKCPQSIPHNIPKAHKMYQYFTFKVLQKYIQILIFGLKIYHLATLVGNSLFALMTFWRAAFWKCFEARPITATGHFLQS
jgi:hypothetical protein